MEFTKLKREIQKLIDFSDPTEIAVNAFASGFVEGIVDGLHFRRPVYVFIGTEYLVMDAPFAMVDEVKKPIELAALWAVGQVSGKLTVHNVFILESLDSHLSQVSSAVRQMVTEAAKLEFSITGKRMFIKEEAIREIEASDEQSELVTCDDCGKKYPEDEINYYEPEDEGGDWIALCETCSIS